MMVFFRTRLGKILIWQNFLKRESPTLIKRFRQIKIRYLVIILTTESMANQQQSL